MRTVKEVGAIFSIPLILFLYWICRFRPESGPRWYRRWGTWVGNIVWDDNT